MVNIHRVAYIAAELSPFASTGGLGDVAAALPAAMAARGIEVIRIIPGYRKIRAKCGAGELRYISAVTLGTRTFHAEIRSLDTGDGVPTVAVDIPEFFDRDGIYGDGRGDYRDNAERFIAFQKAALQFIGALPKPPDVIHCNDWHTGLIPVFVDACRKGWNAQLLPAADRVVTILTIHNLAYQGSFLRSIFSLIGVPESYFSWQGLEFYGNVNFLKGGLVFADRITTVSPTYAREIQTPQFGCGLDGVLRARAADLYGILNGVDYRVWDPRYDQYIPARYTADNLRGKVVCKRHLIKEMGLHRSGNTPLIGMISRLVAQKGLDIVDTAIGRMMELPVQFVLLGTGESFYEQMCRNWQNAYPGRVAVRIDFDVALSHRIEAGADIYLMPSLFEPCGLNQLYSLRYGTVPVVHGTGGLADSVVDLREHPEQGTGFVFSPCTPEQLITALADAVGLYRNQRVRWRAIAKRGMQQDFSWDRAAGEYLQVYGTAG